MPNVLLLGGTTEASALARLLAAAQVATTLSYAGRIDNPRPQPVPIRVGGFGGVAGLVAYLQDHRITHLVDATHPFAATMSAHAIKAARIAGIAHIALTRPAWEAGSGDRWTCVRDTAAAVAKLAGTPRRILLALGRMHVEAFAAQPQHHYLLRFVDPPAAPPGLPSHDLVIDRGPFTAEGDRLLTQSHMIDLVVCKNAGGTGAEAKLVAARQLKLPVVMIDRPVIGDRIEVCRAEDVLEWLGHEATSATDRGV